MKPYVEELAEQINRLLWMPCEDVEKWRNRAIELDFMADIWKLRVEKLMDVLCKHGIGGDKLPPLCTADMATELLQRWLDSHPGKDLDEVALTYKRMSERPR